MKRNLFAAVAVFCSAFLLSNDAFAYVDPGTGTLLIQWLFGMAMASLAVLNIYWHRAKAFFSGKSRNTATGGNAERGADDAGSD